MKDQIITLTHGHTMFKESFHAKVQKMAERLETMGMTVDSKPKQRFSEEHDAVFLIKGFDPEKMRHILSEGRYQMKVQQENDYHIVGLDFC